MSSLPAKGTSTTAVTTDDAHGELTGAADHGSRQVEDNENVCI